LARKKIDAFRRTGIKRGVPGVNQKILKTLINTDEEEEEATTLQEQKNTE